MPVCTATVIFNILCLFLLDQPTFLGVQKYYHFTWPFILACYLALTLLETHQPCFNELGQCTFHHARMGIHVYLPVVVSLISLIVIIGSSVSLRYKLR